jgi:hypothetical protein
MKLAEQLVKLNSFNRADAILIDDTVINEFNFKKMINGPAQLLVINIELNNFEQWIKDDSLANVIVATYDRDYWQNLELVKKLESKKIGVLCLKESSSHRASLESILKTLSSLQFKLITCILAKNNVTEFLTNFNPNESFLWQDNCLVSEKFIGANTLLPQLDLSLVVV